MRIAVLSDVHSNLEALESVVKDIKKHNVDLIYCLGDTIGYGPCPEECYQLVRKISKEMLMGNHEAGLFRFSERMKMSGNASIGLQFSDLHLSKDSKAHIKKLRSCMKNQYGIFCHAAISNSLWKYLTTSKCCKGEFSQMDKKIMFVGHSHCPHIFVERHGEQPYVANETCELDPDNKTIVNVGSVGQPRDDDCRSCYAIYDADIHSVEIRRVFYDIQKTADLMDEYGLPPFLFERLFKGE